MELLCKWNQLSLVKRILIGLILGAVLGFLLPGASFLSLLGTLFVGALKALAPLLVFFLVLHSLAQHKKGAKSNMSTVIALYLIGTLLAALCAVVASFLFPSTLALAQEAAALQFAGLDLTPPLMELQAPPAGPGLPGPGMSGPAAMGTDFLAEGGEGDALPAMRL